MLDKQKKASLGCRRANCRSVLSARQCFLSKYLLTASGAGTAAGLAGPYSMHLCFVGVRMKEGSAFFSPPYTMRGKGIPDHTPRCCQQEQTQAGEQLSHLSAHLPEETSALLKEIKTFAIHSLHKRHWERTSFPRTYPPSAWEIKDLFPTWTSWNQQRFFEHLDIGWRDSLYTGKTFSPHPTPLPNTSQCCLCPLVAESAH